MLHLRDWIEWWVEETIASSISWTPCSSGKDNNIVERLASSSQWCLGGLTVELLEKGSASSFPVVERSRLAWLLHIASSVRARELPAWKEWACMHGSWDGFFCLWMQSMQRWDELQKWLPREIFSWMLLFTGQCISSAIRFASSPTAAELKLECTRFAYFLPTAAELNLVKFNLAKCIVRTQRVMLSPIPASRSATSGHFSLRLLSVVENFTWLSSSSFLILADCTSILLKEFNQIQSGNFGSTHCATINVYFILFSIHNLVYPFLSHQI